jgi:hypothetical protein
MTADVEAEGELSIVLTATVVPQVTAAALIDPETRLAEYAKAVQFYIRHAPVIFLENSTYSLEGHPAFREAARFQVKRFPPSASPERGKGFQEFEMLDNWLAAEARPPGRWLKITGRYQILNIQSLLHECKQDLNSGLIIDQVPRSGMARTYVFCASTEFYWARLCGLYRRCDDRSGAWIERVLFRQLRGRPEAEVHSFKTQPRMDALAGSSGMAFPNGRAQWWCKQKLRRLNRLIDRQYLWYPR